MKGPAIRRPGSKSGKPYTIPKDTHMIHILIAILILTGQHRLPKPPVHHECKTCTWVMQ
jgi:hypothetical protein